MLHVLNIDQLGHSLVIVASVVPAGRRGRCSLGTPPTRSYLMMYPVIRERGGCQEKSRELGVLDRNRKLDGLSTARK